MAFNTWQVKSATFDSSAIASLSGWGVNIDGESFDIFGDGNASIEDTFTDKTAVDVTISGTDVAEIQSLARGDGSSLVLVFQQRVGADGASAASDKTLTLAAASLQSISHNTPHAGAGDWSLTFRCAGPDGAAIYVWS